MRSKTVAAVVVMLLVLSSLISRVIADAGDLDTTFGSGGKVVTAFDEFEGQLWDVAVQADGRIVAVGVWGLDLTIVRYNPDGTLDQTFGSGGRVSTDLDPFWSVAYAVAIQPNGKIIVAGRRSDGSGVIISHFALARYNTDGSLDTSFGAGGVTVKALSDDDTIYDIAIQPDGRIVAVGTTTPNEFHYTDVAVLRYTSIGLLDPSFATGGVFKLDLFGFSDNASGVVIQPDGRILVCGNTNTKSIWSADDDYDFLLLRLNANGNLDTTFGWGGITTTDFYDKNDGAVKAALLPDGRILLGGSATNMWLRSFALARYDSDGSLDTSFGTGGKKFAIFSPLIACGGTDMTLQPNGKIVMLGANHLGVNDPSSDQDFMLARFTSDGSIDNYGSGEYVLTDFLNGSEMLGAITVYGNDQIVAVGTHHQINQQGQYHAILALARYQGDGAPATANLGVAISGSPGQSTITYTITVSNYGPDPSYYVTLKDTIPANTTFQSLTVPQGWVVYSKPAPGQTGTVSVSKSKMVDPHPPFTSTATFTLVVRVNSGVRNTTITNRATVSSSFTDDPFPTNDKAVAQTQVP